MGPISSVIGRVSSYFGIVRAPNPRDSNRAIFKVILPSWGTFQIYRDDGAPQLTLHVGAGGASRQIRAYCYETSGDGITSDGAINLQGNINVGSERGLVWSSTANHWDTRDVSIFRMSPGILEFSAGTKNGNGKTFRSKPLTLTQITSDQNDYNPGLGMFYRLSTDASRNITGLAVNQIDGQVCEIWNIGSFDIVLKHEDAASTAVNRFLCHGSADITLTPNNIAILRYDSTSTRWRVR